MISGRLNAGKCFSLEKAGTLKHVEKPLRLACRQAPAQGKTVAIGPGITRSNLRPWSTHFGLQDRQQLGKVGMK